MQVNALLTRFSGVQPQAGRPQFLGLLQSSVRSLTPLFQGGCGAASGDVVRFRGKTLEPKFIAPMVVENVPKFDPENPETVTFYQGLIERAKTFSRPDVSGRQIGMVVIGKSGRAYLGTNFEVKGGSPANTIHGEAFGLALARQYGETEIERLFINLQPCANCRQIIREVGDPDLPINFYDSNSGKMQTQKISDLFPFGYSYANTEKNMLNTPVANRPKLPEAKAGWGDLTKAAYKAAQESYLPNPRKVWAGLAVQLKDGKIYTANAITISGPNPSITPAMDLLVKLVANQEDIGDIEKAVLVEPENPDYSFKQNTKEILRPLVGSKLPLRVVQVKELSE